MTPLNPTAARKCPQCDGTGIEREPSGWTLAIGYIIVALVAIGSFTESYLSLHACK